MSKKETWIRLEPPHNHNWTDWGYADDARKRAMNAQEGVEFLVDQLQKANDRITLLELEILALKNKDNHDD